VVGGFVPILRPGDTRPVAVLQLPSAAQVAAVARGAAPAGLGYWVPLVARPAAPAVPVRPGRSPSAATAMGDLRVLLDGAAGPTERLAALDRTVDRIVWLPRSPQVREALRWRAREDACDLAAVKQRELRAAVYLVLAERGRPQTHRFGARWLTDGRGRTLEAVPAELPDELFWRWFADEVRKAAEAALLGRPYPPVPGETRSRFVGLDALEELAGPGPDPLAWLVEREERGEVSARWRELLGSATPGQRALLRAMAQEPSRGGSVTAADAARRLGLAPSTARVQWKRLVDRLRPA
jgi:hypothetical protein